MHAQAVPIYTDGSKSGEGVGCAAVFPDFDMFISLTVIVTSIFTVELCAIFLTLSHIFIYDSNNFVIYSGSRSAMQALGGAFIHTIL